MCRPTEVWLEAVNAKLRSGDVPPANRAWVALRMWAEEIGGSQVLLPSDTADYMNTWFAERTGGKSRASGPFFFAAHYFDASFWPVELPLVYGGGHVRIFDALRGMPIVLMNEIAEDPGELERYKKTWLDWMDIASGFDDLERSSRDRGPLFHGLLQAARNELGAATVDLLALPAGQHAAHLSRNAAEKVLKMVLVDCCGYTEKRLKKVGHEIDDVVASLQREGRPVDPELSISFGMLPKYEEGYSPTIRPTDALARIYDTGRQAAAWVARSLSDRGMGEETS